jgi:hypothetical protein
VSGDGHRFRPAEDGRAGVSRSYPMTLELGQLIAGAKCEGCDVPGRVPITLTDPSKGIFTEVLRGTKCQVKMRWPLLPVILTSGHPREHVGELPPGVAYIPKPWRPLNVLIAAEQALASARVG